MKLFRNPVLLGRSEAEGLCFFLLALVLFGVPLLSPHLNFGVRIACGVLGALSALAFIKNGKTFHATSPNFYLIVLTATFLAVLTAIAFYRPMLEHFWAGYDEPVLLSINRLWLDTYDKCCGRPLAGLEAFLGNLALPGKIDSLPVTSALERWILAAALFLFVITLLPDAVLLAIASGILMVINPTETLRFTPGLSIPYGGALAFLFAASLVFTLSYNLASRALLLLACALLGIAFLHYETIFPVSLILPALLWLLPSKPERRLWAIAWYSTTLLAAVRFILFFLGGSTYQSNYSQHFKLSALENLPLLLKPMLRFVSPLYTSTPIAFLPIAIGFATFIFLIVLDRFHPRQMVDSSHRRKMALTAAIGLLALFLTILPEISVPVLLRASPNFDGDLTSRLEFTPGPFQSIVWAAVIGWAASFLPRPQYGFAAGIAILVTCSTLDSWQLQANKGALNSYLDLQKESDIFRAAAPMFNQAPEDAVIFFAIPDDKPSPLGFGYHPFHMSCLLFGRPAYAGHYSPELGAKFRMTAYPSPLSEPNNYIALTGIKNLVVLVVDRDGNVTELKDAGKLQASAPDPKAPGSNFGPCSIRQAAMLADGSLPFLLPKK